MRTTFLAINHSAFNKLTPETRYWVGFLMADGCLTLAKRRRKSGKTVFYKMIALNVCSKDVRHLRRFREFLKSKHKITLFEYESSFGRTSQARFAFISEPIWKQLVSLGLKPRKSKGCTVSSQLIFDRDFWRGMVDGDGSVVRARNKQCGRLPLIHLDGCLSLLSQFQTFVQAVTGNVYKISRHPRVKNFGRLALSSKPAVKLITRLYSNAEVALCRKSKIARKIMEVSLAN